MLNNPEHYPVVNNRYKILGVLNAGDQGTVYQARDLNFPDVKKLVAVKEKLLSGHDRDTRLKMFQREANILVMLDHPSIPSIYDFFEWNQRAYLVTQYIGGSDLEERLSKTKELSIKWVIERAIALCYVLDYLHNQQPFPIVYRNLEPAHVMVDDFADMWLIGFGRATATDPGVRRALIVTEGYSAPEQYQGIASPLSDIFSLGATLHHLLTRRDPRHEPPFSFAERPIRDFNDHVPPELAAIVDKALAFEAQNRYQSCHEMKQALAALL